MIKKCEHLPKNFDSDRYEIFSGTPSRYIDDGDVIDLGNRSIEVLHTPGHSPGHLCFFEIKTGYLFTGDLIYKGTLYANYPSTDPTAFLRSVKKICGLDIKRIFPAHHSTSIEPDFVSRVLYGLTMIESEGRLCHGSGLVRFEDWSILL